MDLSFKSLHWLPVEHRLTYKILLIAYRALTFSSPEYISSLLDFRKPGRSGLRSSKSSTLDLSIPKTRRSCGDQAFASAAPRLWNNLPTKLKDCRTVEHFKASLKTYLMAKL